MPVNVGLPTAPWSTTIAVPIVTPFELLVTIGSVPSNTYIGASQACNSVYLRTQALVGDEILVFSSGTQPVLRTPRCQTVFDITTSLDEKHLFEKRYSDRKIAWPSECLGEPHPFVYAGTKNAYANGALVHLRNFDETTEVMLAKLGTFTRFGRMGDVIFTKLTHLGRTTFHTDAIALLET